MTRTRSRSPLVGGGAFATVAVAGWLAACGGDSTADDDDVSSPDAGIGLDAALACGVLGGPCCDPAPICDGELACIGGACGCADAVASRGPHSCARRLDGTLWCFGRNHHGQLGNDSGASWSVPVLAKLPVDAIVRAFDTGVAHTCALADTGLYCWGYNADGEVGDATVEDRYVPVALPMPGGGSPSSLTDIVLGGFHSCAVGASGLLWCWGDNEAGQIGNGMQGADVHQLAPIQVPGIAGAVGVAAGENHTCALLAGGDLLCWGLNASGQLGDGTTSSRASPVPVRSEGGGAFTDVAGIGAGAFHTCARKSDGELWCWGRNDHGQLGIGSSGTPRLSPVKVPIDDVAAVTAGEQHTCARTGDGTLWCWGSNASGQLGTGDNESSANPRRVAGLSIAVDLAAGDIHTCAAADGAVFCWGYNDFGELGAGEIPSTNEPVKAALTCP